MAANESCREEVELTIPWPEVEKEANRIVDSLRKSVQIPGFRKGKVPPSVLRTRFRNEIRQEVLDEMLPQVFWRHARENKLHIVGAPDISDLHFEEGEDVRFKAAFEVVPEFELAEYRRIPVPFADPNVTDEEVDAELEKLREQHASFRNLDPKPLEDGDIAVISLKSGDVEDVPKIDQEETTLTIGAEDTLEGFSEALRGKSPGEEADFEVSYPEDFSNESLAGKTIPFHAVVTGVRVKELPELDDDFAADVGDFRTLDELKSRIRENLNEMRRHQAREQAKDKIVDVLAERHEFPVPQRMVEEQIQRRVDRSLRQILPEGVDPSTLQIDWSKVRESERPRAIRDVRAGLVIERIATVENIDATSEEVDAQVERYARENQMSVAGARRKLTEDGALDRIASHIRNEKTLNFLFDEAEKVEPEEDPAEHAPAGESSR